MYAEDICCKKDQWSCSIALVLSMIYHIRDSFIWEVYITWHVPFLSQG
jgi:hypothetical protein